ncbi:hypothetical protein VIBNISOn1_1050012 [Vibrio nigripulchritudo SOn1]|uniref:Phosphoadenosine phosphosulphate reductase domain-containing protein n=1 Tax=Vibrio nigripulchritudo SOn1 TaxID=1238450 RepID=A0AAV2VHR4_9VIBR|nr:hypothetical protein [Vibrio nigripulchritudo]CCO44186.1 hypothetical protein VIBNISOn1_1050012 [Vibrio nigripulchritudo SOn1]
MIIKEVNNLQTKKQTTPPVNIWSQFSDAINVIDVTNQITLQEAQAYSMTRQKFYEEVNQLVALLLATNAVCVVAASLGKDSTIILLIALEAYRQCKERRKDFDRELIVNTVDPRIEELPLKMYVNFTIPRIEQYAKKVGINLTYNHIKPSKMSSFLYRYVGARKFLTNATRNGDCTELFKLSPARRQFALDRKRLKVPIINLVGSRKKEGVRRSTNMKKQDIYSRTSMDVQDILKHGASEATYAPIRNWTAVEVFDALKIAGSDPLIQIDGEGIPHFEEHSGLLIEIYGDASTPETCSLNVGQDGVDTNSMCGSSNPNRMGCTFCTIVTENKSGASFSKKVRWSSLHLDKALRIRDYMYRLSMNEEARGFHARSIDPYLNRIMLQSNTLKPQLIAKIYRLLCQLSADSYNTARENAWGNVCDFEGYKDIENDPHMNRKTKKLFLEMYSAQIVEHLYDIVTRDDAILLSYLWAIDGVALLPYTPIAIYEEVHNKGKRIPYPKLNSEVGYNTALKSTPVREAFALNSMSQDFISTEYVDETIYDVFGYQPVNVFDADSCESNMYDKDKLTLTVYFEPRVNIGSKKVDVHLIKIAIKEMNRTFPIERFEVVRSEIVEQCERFVFHHIEKILDPAVVLPENEVHKAIDRRIESLQCSKKGIEVKLRSLAIHEINGLPNKTPRARKSKQLKESTKRVRKNGKPTTTRLRFYAPRTISELTEAHRNTVQMITHSRALEHLNPTPIHNEYCFDDAPLDSIYLDTEIGNLYWHDLDGWERALRTYYDWLNRRLEHRKTTRFYSGGEVIRQMHEYGGITVSPSYYRDHKRILYRTNILNQLNAFNYHSMSYRQLCMAADKGELVTMAQHRSDKARHALKIRQIRNDDRRLTKELLQQSPISTFVLKRKIDEVKTMIDSFNDNSGSLEYDFLSNFYAPAVRNIDCFMKEFFSKSERDYVISNEHALVELNWYFNKAFDIESTSVIEKLDAKQTANLMLELI